MSLQWYINRLAAMSPREIFHRAGEYAKRRQSRRTRYSWSDFRFAPALSPIPGLAEQLKANWSNSLTETLQESVSKLLDGKFAAHGVSWPERAITDLFPADLWRLDPVSGKLWPDNSHFCFDIKYRHRRDLGDIKFVWDLNRLQFLLPLAVASSLWNDDRAQQAIETAVKSWVDNNPPFQGVGWNSGIELALRAITLIFVVSLCGDRLSQETRASIATVLNAHFFWLTRFPSANSSANNHLVAELVAEFMLALALSLPASATVARDGLEREVQLQLLADGSPAEQSPTYGAFTAEMLLSAALAAKLAGSPFSSAFFDKLILFSEFIGVIGDGHGRVPAVGDDDEGRVLSLCDAREYAYPTSIARAISAFTGRDATITQSSDRPEIRDALFGMPNGQAMPDAGLRTFANGGYTSIRESRAERKLQMLIDHGPLGYLSIAAHGHADANAFTLSLDDEAIFVDPGTYLYHSGGAWRDWFRGTGSHNTLRVNGEDQSIISGPFNWSHKAAGSLLSARADHAGWSLVTSHDGYRKRFGVQHQRSVSSTEWGITINDELPGTPSAALRSELVFQLAPGLEATKRENAWIIHKQDVALIALSFSQPGVVSVSSGGDMPGLGGWVSGNFGDREEAVRLVWSGNVPPEGITTDVKWTGLNFQLDKNTGKSHDK